MPVVLSACLGVEPLILNPALALPLLLPPPLPLAADVIAHSAQGWDCFCCQLA